MTDITKGRVVLAPGYIIINSGDIPQFIDAHNLAALYGVPFDKCVVWNIGKAFTRRRADVFLYPQRHSSDYLLPKPARELLA